MRTILLTVAVVLSLVAVSSANALTITGTAAPKYLVSGSPVNSTGPGVIKMSFENNTVGTNVQLCAGTAAQFTAGTCGVQLADSGGPGFMFFVVMDANTLNGKLIYVLRAVGTAPAKFTIVIE